MRNPSVMSCGSESRARTLTRSRPDRCCHGLTLIRIPGLNHLAFAARMSSGHESGGRNEMIRPASRGMFA